MPVTETPLVRTTRKKPHVDAVDDWNAQQTISLLWDRYFELLDRLTAAEATITALTAASNTNEETIAKTQLTASHALVAAQAPSGISGGGGVPGDGGGGGGGGDGGGGEIGCQAAGSSGHDTGGLLNPVRAGQIVCGTGNEFATLRNPVPNTGDEAADSLVRQANQEELIRRMIWHLKQAGFTAGRQQNPSGIISKDKLTVVVDGVTRAYDIFTGVSPYVAIPQHMTEVTPAHMIDDEGIPDS